MDGRARCYSHAEYASETTCAFTDAVFRHHDSQRLGYWMDGGSAALAWLVVESLYQLLPLQPDEQLGAADGCWQTLFEFIPP